MGGACLEFKVYVAELRTDLSMEMTPILFGLLMARDTEVRYSYVS